MKRLRLVYLLLLLGAVLPAWTPAAHAYVGPGAGLSAFGSLFSVVAALFLAVVGFVWYPVKRLFKRGKAHAPAATVSAPAGPDSAE
jgi:hypothetical protein